MRVKTYRAPTLAEALAEVKADMGRDAVIIQTRRLRQGGFLGMLATEIFEVTAAVDPASLPQPRVAAPVYEKPGKAQDTEDARLLAVHLELAGMRKTLETALSSIQAQGAPQPAAEAKAGREELLGAWARANDVEPAAAAALVRRVGTQKADSLEQYYPRLHDYILPFFQKAEAITIRPGTCRAVALVGPTGVGKTTTLAKLAANFALREKARVALITADTYRIAAVEQLKVYADLIGVPLEVVYSPQELKAALQRHNDKQLVFIDTAGRSPANQPQMAELESLMSVDPNIEKQLVLSATTKFTECLDAARRFQDSNPQKYLFTKIDEACNLGTVFSLLHHVPRPLSYITTGQNVPDDIEFAEPERLTALMLRGVK